MLITVDKKIPVEAKNNLSKYGKVIEFESESITDDYISGHPDLFFVKTPVGLIVAPNLPAKYKSILRSNGIEFAEGDSPVRPGYPACAPYNCVISDNYLIHKKSLTEKNIYVNNPQLEIINVAQGMTRCSLITLNNKHAITSDRSIYSELKFYGFDILCVEPAKILLPGMNHGLFGGTAGISDNKVFFLGSLDYFPQGTEVRCFITNAGYETIELFDGQLFDGGSIIFI